MATSNDNPRTIEIQLTHKGTSLVTTIDNLDKDLIGMTWFPALAVNGKYYVWGHKMVNYELSRFALHRIILSRKLGRDLLDAEEVDHKDRNPLNNKRNNLRLATRSQNIMNRPARIDCKSGYKGVSKIGGVWRAVCMGKHLGCYSTPEEAAIVYNHFAFEVQGEFACLNNIPNWGEIHPIKRDGKGIRKDNKSGVSGVSYFSKQNKWFAYVGSGENRVNIGLFSDLNDAINAREEYLKDHKLC